MVVLRYLCHDFVRAASRSHFAREPAAQFSQRDGGSRVGVQRSRSYASGARFQVHRFECDRNGVRLGLSHVQHWVFDRHGIAAAGDSHKRYVRLLSAQSIQRNHPYTDISESILPFPSFCVRRGAGKVPIAFSGCSLLQKGSNLHSQWGQAPVSPSGQPAMPHPLQPLAPPLRAHQHGD